MKRMPLFEYRCRDCEHDFEAFVTADRKAECPSCRSANLVKRWSTPGMVGTSNGSAKAAMPMAGGCGAGGAHCACRAGQN